MLEIPQTLYVHKHNLDLLPCDTGIRKSSALSHLCGQAPLQGVGWMIITQLHFPYCHSVDKDMILLLVIYVRWFERCEQDVSQLGASPHYITVFCVAGDQERNVFAGSFQHLIATFPFFFCQLNIFKCRNFRSAININYINYCFTCKTKTLSVVCHVIWEGCFLVSEFTHYFFCFVFFIHLIYFFFYWKTYPEDF